MMIQRRKTFEYLGMDVDFSEKGVFAVSMILFIDKIEANFWEAITKSSATPHNQHLFRSKMIRTPSSSKRSMPNNSTTLLLNL